MSETSIIPELSFEEAPGGHSPASLAAEELRELSRRTVEAYESDAEGFWEATRDHDVDQNRHTLLCHLEGEGPFAILDLGCGPGRDLLAFRELGHQPVGLDGTPAFVAMAREFSGCEVWCQDFLALDLPPARFDGVFANATLQHVPAQELPRVLRELAASLRPGGVLFTSLPRGENQEGFHGERYSHFWDLASWREVLTGAGFGELEHYYRPPGKPREEQPWLASAWRRP